MIIVIHKYKKSRDLRDSSSYQKYAQMRWLTRQYAQMKHRAYILYEFVLKERANKYMYGYTSSHYDYNYRPVYSNAWTPSMVKLNQNLRALWEQHVYWTRLTVNSIVGRLPDEKETTARLLRNPTDFAEALEPLYGTDIANKFAKLLRDHLTIAAELVKTLQAGDSAAAANIQKRWYANAEAIADFLSRINPYWSKENWKSMLFEHLKLLTQEVMSRHTGNYMENVATNDRIESQALEMADVMTNGIIQQFPSAFTA